MIRANNEKGGYAPEAFPKLGMLRLGLKKPD